MRISVDRPKRAARSSWLATVPLEALSMFPSLRGSAGDLSIVYLPSTPPPERDQDHISFEPGAAYLLNRGTGSETLFVFGGSATSENDLSELLSQRFGPAVQNDSVSLEGELAVLPTALRQVADKLLGAAQQLAPGSYFQRTSAGRYVNRPDNFWTLKVQPRDKSLRITVRGRPDRFEGIRGLEVKADQNGYSAFKVKGTEDLSRATSALERAKNG